MNLQDELTGGRKPYFINTADGDVTTKKFFLIVVLQDTQFANLESNTSPTGAAANKLDEKTSMNIGSKTLPAGTIINCDGEAYFTRVNLTSGLVAAYIPLI